MMLIVCVSASTSPSASVTVAVKLNDGLPLESGDGLNVHVAVPPAAIAIVRTPSSSPPSVTVADCVLRRAVQREASAGWLNTAPPPSVTASVASWSAPSTSVIAPDRSAPSSATVSVVGVASATAGAYLNRRLVVDHLDRDRRRRRKPGAVAVQRNHLDPEIVSVSASAGSSTCGNSDSSVAVTVGAAVPPTPAVSWPDRTSVITAVPPIEPVSVSPSPLSAHVIEPSSPVPVVGWPAARST